jgi:hypothetical protein
VLAKLAAMSCRDNLLTTMLLDWMSRREKLARCDPSIWMNSMILDGEALKILTILLKRFDCCSWQPRNFLILSMKT